jgi:hypothetical protein
MKVKIHSIACKGKTNIKIRIKREERENIYKGSKAW